MCLTKYRKQIEANQGKVTNISNEFDFVNILLFSVAGDRRYIKSTTTFGIMDGSSDGIASAFMHKFGGWHSPYSMFTLEDGDVVLDEYVEQSDLMKEMQGLLGYYAMYMDEEDFRFVIYSVMSMMMEDPDAYGDVYEMPEGFIERIVALTKGYAEKNKGFDFIELFGVISFLFGINNAIRIWSMYNAIDSEGYALLIRDFSDDVKQQLLSIVEEVDDEPWYDITRWDILYRVEGFFGGLDFSTNAGELNEYYRKLIDIQGVSKNQILKIFADVRTQDNIFAKEIKKINSSVEKINTVLKTIQDSFRI